jgi:ABC-type lipoprotein export system ATPase subunit
MSTLSTAPAPPAWRTYKVVSYGGAVAKGPSYSIRYVADDPACLWEATTDRLTWCLVSSPSGSGKTTFLEQLYHRLVDGPERVDLNFSFAPDIDRLDSTLTGYVPQNPPMVNHWPVSALVRRNSAYFQVLFPDDSSEQFYRRRLGELSGGQKRKVYACSTLDRLASRPVRSAFLLLDETFDGLGEAEAARCLEAISQVWTKNQAGSLHLLLVSHLGRTTLADHLTGERWVSFNVEHSSTKELVVRVKSES